MIDVIQKPRDACLYEIRQKGQRDPCYVVVPNTNVRVRFKQFLNYLFFCGAGRASSYKTFIQKVLTRFKADVCVLQNMFINLCY